MEKPYVVVRHNRRLLLIFHQIGITLTQQPVDAKTNEIPIAKEILQTFHVDGKIVTTDALLTQKALCQTLCEKNTDYVLPIKANQRQTYQDIQDLFKPEKPPKTDVDPQTYHARTFETLHHEAEAHADTLENLSHRTRDVTFREDASQVRCGNIPQVMAALRNTVITLLRISGHTQIEKAQRFLVSAHPWHAFKILQKTKFDN